MTELTNDDKNAVEQVARLKAAEGKSVAEIEEEILFTSGMSGAYTMEGVDAFFLEPRWKTMVALAVEKNLTPPVVVPPTTTTPVTPALDPGAVIDLTNPTIIPTTGTSPTGVPRNPGILSGGGVGGASSTPSFAFEQVAAKLEPFDIQEVIAKANPATHAFGPILDTHGLVFPYNPVINEGISVRYDNVELTHSNESYHVYRSTENVRITLTDCVWTCDTFDHAIYTMAVLHFFRSYRLMDFGVNRTGRPPSPMWFSAYGHYAFRRVPCLLEKADWSWPIGDMDFVGIPEFGSSEYTSKTLKYKKTADSSYTWMPMVFKISSISLIVQNSPAYWLGFDLDRYRSGDMLRQSRTGSFYEVRPSRTAQTSPSDMASAPQEVPNTVSPTDNTVQSDESLGAGPTPAMGGGSVGNPSMRMGGGSVGNPSRQQQFPTVGQTASPNPISRDVAGNRTR